MSPQEKANELVDAYKVILMEEDTECGNEILCTIIAKKSALIAVDTVLFMASHWATIQYWNEVKHEIEKL
jgi:hypothetical protein